MKDSTCEDINAVSVEINWAINEYTEIWMEPAELINLDAHHCAGSEVTHLKDKSALKDHMSHDFCYMMYNRSYNPAEPESVKCWVIAPSE